ncbi:acyl-CoA carboxylase subunit epsilon [Sphaerisporangium sp. NPDC005288]|uniref:Acyl-CoA carboxylase subunit epsilon n=1 Tax=Sphaerisporangium rhizosphaerae TaxID=2269375 RepID=A0ABW2P3U8_9ACTN
MDQPYLRIVHGGATPEEVAALVIAVATRTAKPAQPVRSRELWRNPAHQMRRVFPTGPGAWRASSRPH